VQTSLNVNFTVLQVLCKDDFNSPGVCAAGIAGNTRQFLFKTWNKNNKNIQ